MDDEQEHTAKSQPPLSSPEFYYGRGEIAPGTVVAGRYKVLEKLGEGGMAVVYLVEQIFLRETLALKVLTAGLSDTSTVRFQKEAQVCRLLDHPHLIKVVDFALLENDAPYLVMEFIDGESLADILKRKGQLSESEAIEVFLQIMDGLAYAHNQKVIHRDLKPSNIMLFQGPNKELQVKILDFGIAKMTGKDTLNTMTLTGTGEIFGSPLFMSPEQCLGRTVDLRSDLYSIGCALYQVLTGAPPFAGDSALATMMLHLEGTALPLKQASLGKEFSPAIEKLTMKLLQKLPEDRYQSAHDVYEDLEAIKSRRAPKHQTSPQQTKDTKVAVSPAVLGMIAVCVILAIGSIAVLFAPKKTPQDNSQKSETAKPAETAPAAVPQKLPYFAMCSIRDWRKEQGPWVLNFPEEEVGKLTYASDPRGMDVTLKYVRPAQGVVPLPQAAPLLFTTPLHSPRSHELMRFRPDEIQELRLEDSEIDDGVMAELPYFTNLQGLYLDNCLSLTDKCLPAISELRNLVFLYIASSSDHINPAQLGRVIGSSSIKVFGATYFEHTDALCRALASSESIAVLRFEKCDLTNEGLTEIAKLNNLKRLHLLEIKALNDKSLGVLLACKKLELIDFHNVNITVDSFPTLKKLPRGCRIVFEQLARWSAADQKLYRDNFPNGCVP